MPELDISGVPVSFPFEPYDVQKTYMEKVMECLQQSVNGVLESPTGTGKTLSLLCSTLAWLMMKKAQLQIQAATNDSAFVSGLQNKINFGAGTVKDGESAGLWGSGMPKVIYASRTHSQLTQAVHELKRTTYNHVKVAVLGSRDQLCIHPEVSRETNNANKLHLCRMHVGAKSCMFYNNVDAKKEDPAFNSDGILDIEDLVKVGKKLRCCPYYIAKDLKQKADIIFMPYNYLLDPKTRRAQGLELANNVVILDEAHNIEKMCEESSSLQLRSTDIALCIDEITTVMKQLVEDKPVSEGFSQTNEAGDFDPEELALLKTMMLELEKVIDAIAVGTEGSTHPGDFIFELLSKAELTHAKKVLVLELIDKLVQFLSTTSQSPWQRKGSGLQKFSDLLKVVFSGNVATLSHVENIRRCYKVHIAVETVKKGRSEGWGSLTSNKASGRVLSYWCFSPGFGMQQLMEQGVRCILLTSGTLSPLPPLVSELGIPLPVRLENPHVIKQKQVCIAVVGQGPDGWALSSSFKSRNDPGYISSLGRTILNFSRVIPNGLLVFFSSYPIMKKCQEDWQISGIWSQLNAVKQIFVEPQGKDSFNETMAGYYAQVSQGACFMAVVRGKVSEGLDFADANGRAVIITGVPFPPFMDPRVVLKQKYLDETRAKDKTGLSCLSGAEWYQLEASRAVNQAVGRVIRHANDYGAILLCDHRFNTPSFKQRLSVWLRPHIKVYPNFGVAAKDVREFFRAAGNNLPTPKLSVAAASPLVPLVGVSAVPRPLPSRDQPTRRPADQPWSPADYLVKTQSVKQPQVTSLFTALNETSTAIDFNAVSTSATSTNHSRVARVVRPLNVVANPSVNAKPDKRAAIITYLKELKMALSQEDYLKFGNTFKEYKSDSNGEEFLKRSLEIFSPLEQFHSLLRDFHRFLKKEHVHMFLKACGKLKGCRNKQTLQ